MATPPQPAGPITRLATCTTPTRCSPGSRAGPGAMVAAATMGLPERAEQGRNYDYRYAWIRDQCFAGLAAAVAGGDPPAGQRGRLRRATDCWTTARSWPPRTPPTGDPVPDEQRLDLPGYPGGADVVGNWVNDQFQLDAFGEALQLFARGRRARSPRCRRLAARRRSPPTRSPAMARTGRRHLGARPAHRGPRAGWRAPRGCAPSPAGRGPATRRRWEALADTLVADASARTPAPRRTLAAQPDG